MKAIQNVLLLREIERRKLTLGLESSAQGAPEEALPVTPIEFYRIPLYAKQGAIVDDVARFTITEATTKAGKTASHIEWILEESIRMARGNWWWIAPTSDVADIAFRRVQARLRGFLDSAGQLKQVSEPIPFLAQQQRKYISVAGAVIWFKSADRPDSLYGEDVYGAVLDEASRCKSEAWTALYTTLTATKGRAKLIGNVKGRKNFAYQLARKAEAGEPDWSYHKLTAWDAIEGGVIERDIVEQARRDLPPAVFRELYEAQAGDDTGNPFGIEAIQAVMTLTEQSRKPAAFIGVDLAKSNDWVWVVGLDVEGCECLSERWQAPWNITRDRLLALSDVPTLVDSTGVGDPIVEDLQRKKPLVQGFKFSSTSKQQIMEGLASSIQRRLIQLHDSRLRAELEAFEFAYTRTGVRYAAPAGSHDDGVCGLALANHLRLMHKPGWTDLPILGLT